MQSTVLQKEITLDGQWSALAQVAQACVLQRSVIADAAVKGAVWKAKAGGRARLRRVRDLDENTSAGDRIFVNYNREVLEQRPDNPVLIHDLGNYSVWYKPSGMFSQGSKWSDHCTVTFTAQKMHGKPCLLVHRLDRAASGLMVLAHTRNACAKLAGLFEQRKVKKTYSTTVHGHVEEKTPWKITSPIDNKNAESIIKSVTHLKYNNNEQSELVVEIKTGRKHQIRSHLVVAGYPVVGDRLFDPDRDHTVDLQLTATELEFICPFSDKNQIVRLDPTVFDNQTQDSRL